MTFDPSMFRTPGQLIQGLLAGRGWSKRTLAVILNVGESTITRLVGDKQPIDAKTALVFEDVFGIAADVFLTIQQNFDLAHARIAAQPDPGRAARATLYGDLPVAEMIKRGWIAADNVRDTKKVENELMRFFGANRIEDIEVLPHAAKKTAVNHPATPAQLAWLYRVKAIAEELLPARYSAASIEAALPKLHALAVAPEEARMAPRILAECGIRFVVVESLPAAKIDGVCFWLDEKSPVVGLSMRHDRIDNFWFVLRHELEHVRLGHGRSEMILDTDLEGDRAGTGPDVSEEERLANAAAQEFCVPKAKMDAFIARKAPFFSERDLIGFSRLLGVHPGIVAGQLQHRTKRFDRFRQHLAGIRSNVQTGAAVDGWGNVYPLGT